MAKGGKTPHRIVAAMNLGWGIWAMVGGVYFLYARSTLGDHTAWRTFHESLVHGYAVVGVSLILCGVVSLLASLCPGQRLKQIAAILCAVWCLTCAVVLQWATPEIDQGDIDAWLLLMCAFTCAMRWAVITMEPHIDP